MKMEVVGVVYEITNLINGKIYIGITKCDLNKRLKEHKCQSGKCGTRKAHLYTAMRKYGFNNFKIEKIKTCYSESQLYNSEIYFIGKFGTRNNEIGYNNSIGGERSMKGARHSDETKKIISLKSKGRPPNETSFKIGHRQVLTPEWKNKISAANKGRILSEETKNKIREKRKQQVISHSLETRKKISYAQKGKKLSKEHIEHIRAARIGVALNVKRSIEYNGKMYYLNELSAKYGIKRLTLRNRLKYGWTIEDAINKPIRKK